MQRFNCLFIVQKYYISMFSSITRFYSHFLDECSIRLSIKSTFITSHRCSGVEKVYSEVRVISFDWLRYIFDRRDVEWYGIWINRENHALVFFICKLPMKFKYLHWNKKSFSEYKNDCILTNVKLQICHFLFSGHVISRFVGNWRFSYFLLLLSARFLGQTSFSNLIKLLS